MSSVAKFHYCIDCTYFAIQTSHFHRLLIQVIHNIVRHQEIDGERPFVEFLVDTHNMAASMI